MKGVKVTVRAVAFASRRNTKARAWRCSKINPTKPGHHHGHVVESNQSDQCGAKRIGVVGVFLPPLTG